MSGGRGRQAKSVWLWFPVKAKQGGARDKPRPRGKRITGRWERSNTAASLSLDFPRTLPGRRGPVARRVIASGAPPLAWSSAKLGRCSRTLRRRCARARERDITVWPAQGIRSSVAHEAPGGLVDLISWLISPWEGGHGRSDSSSVILLLGVTSFARTTSCYRGLLVATRTPPLPWNQKQGPRSSHALIKIVPTSFRLHLK
jgi:hypothetical protein